MDEHISQKNRDKSKSKSTTKRKKHRKEKSKLPCGACILITILSGDDSIIRAYFFSMYGKKKQLFPNMRRLGQKALEMAAEDICMDVYLALWEKVQAGTLQKIRFPKSYIWTTVLHKAIDKDLEIKRFVSFDEIENRSGKEGGSDDWAA